MWVTDLKTNTTTRFPAKDTYYAFEDKNRVLVLTWDKNNGETYHRYKVSQLVDLDEEPFISFAALDTFLAANLGFNGGGGTSGTTQNLSETLLVDNQTGGRNILVNDSDSIELENASLLRKGTYNIAFDGNIEVSGINTNGTGLIGALDNWAGGSPGWSNLNGIYVKTQYAVTPSGVFGGDIGMHTPEPGTFNYYLLQLDFNYNGAAYFIAPGNRCGWGDPNDDSQTDPPANFWRLLSGADWSYCYFTNPSTDPYNFPIDGWVPVTDALPTNLGGNGYDYIENYGGGFDLKFASTTATGGISEICSVGYEKNWQSGIEYIYDLDGYIRSATNCLNVVPGNTFDLDKKFKVGSLWTLDTGLTYICTSNVVDSATWEIYSTVRPNLTQVLQVSDIGSSAYNLDTGDYTFQVEDRLKINFFNNQIEESNSVFLDKTIIFPDNSTIIFQNQINSIPVENINLFDFLFTTDATVYYKGFKVTSLPIQPGDYCVLKLVGFETDFNTQVWSLSILSKPTNPKVFTALLTQSGTSDSITLSSGDSVIKGITYKIDGGSDGDFSNVGAPSNDDSTSFIATINGVPNSYGSTVLLYDPGAPIAKILENTLGNVWFEYSAEGLYLCKSSTLFTENKTTIDMDAYCQNGNPAAQLIYKDLSTADFTIGTYKDNFTNGYLTNNRLEIKVYN